MINHLAIIMDWNRRWAKEKFLPAILWHKYWADNVEIITNLAWEKWIKYLTLWWLSTENLEKRSKEEVEWIIKLIDNIESYLEKMIKKWLKFKTMWNLSKLPKKSQEILNKVKSQTKNNTWIVLTIALVYWWQDEIIRWIKKFIENWWNIDELSTQSFRNYIDSWFLPNPDVIVRTGWDIRHSWFFLYDSAYSEYYFTEKKWPEFDEKELNNIINFFDSSKRNFWK
jgi:undecaprenyl diphosphate synthase